MLTRRHLLAGAIAVPAAMAARAAWAAATPPSLYDILREPELLDAAISPSGKLIALLTQTPVEGGAFTSGVTLVSGDAPADPGRRLDLGDMYVERVAWANDQRLLIWLKKEFKLTYSGPAGSGEELVTNRRLLAVGADGSKPVMLFESQKRDFRGNMNLGMVVDDMPNDPDRILMQVGDYERGVWALYRVNVLTGAAELVERGTPLTRGWLSFGGVPIVRYDSNNRGTVTTLNIRAPGETDWTPYRRMRRDEHGRIDFDVVATTADPAVVMAISRDDQQATSALRTFDLRTRTLGAEVVRRAAHDVEYVVTDNTGQLFGTVFWEDRLGYEFVDPALKPHLRGIDAFFGKTCNVRFGGMDAARNRFLLWVTGPTEPGAWFFYDRTSRTLEPLGAAREWLAAERLATVETLSVKARDGQALTAYLTVPTGPASGPRPLVVMPHGGPEVRDHYDWDDWAQALAAKGWLVLQPNFRGSDGYGRAFMEAGRRRWGDLMQHDVEDCVARVVAAGRADPGRIAIMGASYGGYAALMGALLRPELYKAVVSIAGVTDLPDMLDWDRKMEGGDSPVYDYWRKVIGDPATDAAMLQAASPCRRAGGLAAPVLLIHGKDDDIVPVEQSKIMRDALKKAGKPVEYLEIKDMGHGGWTPQQSMTVLSKAIDFLAPRLRV